MSGQIVAWQTARASTVSSRHSLNRISIGRLADVRRLLRPHSESVAIRWGSWPGAGQQATTAAQLDPLNIWEES